MGGKREKEREMGREREREMGWEGATLWGEGKGDREMSSKIGLSFDTVCHAI